MPYCTLQDLIDRYGDDEIRQLADRDGDTVIDTEVIDRALADADAEIDGWLRGRYQLPLAETPASLTLAACRIARYQLYSDAPTDKVEADYDRAIAWLRDLAAGRVSLVAATGEEPEATAGMPEFDGGRSVFGGGGY